MSYIFLLCLVHLMSLTFPPKFLKVENGYLKFIIGVIYFFLPLFAVSCNLSVALNSTRDGRSNMFYLKTTTVFKK